MTINRRTFSALLASAVAAPRVSFAQAKVNSAFYSGVGGQLTHTRSISALRRCPNSHRSRSNMHGRIRRGDIST